MFCVSFLLSLFSILSGKIWTIAFAPRLSYLSGSHKPTILTTGPSLQPFTTIAAQTTAFKAVVLTANALGRKNVALSMFTGIVEEMGTVVTISSRDDMTLWDGTEGKGTELVVSGDVVMNGAYLGCSICVNGVCLTATSLDTLNKQFTVGLAPETLDKTYFRNLRPGLAVNLERASEIGGRNSGHFVQGHVDGTGTIVDKRIDGDSLRVTIEVDDEFVDNIMKYIVPKGFIAIDGTSLTVVDVNASSRRFSFMLVEYTQKKIIIPKKSIGEKVNLEVDVLGKYSETALSSLLPRLEALEAKVESLERQLCQSETNPSRLTGGGTAFDTNESKTPNKRMITESTPVFKNNISDQGETNVDPNTYMVRPKVKISITEDEKHNSGAGMKRVNLTPDPKMDDTGGNMNGDGFVTISGS